MTYFKFKIVTLAFVYKMDPKETRIEGRIPVRKNYYSSLDGKGGW